MGTLTGWRRYDNTPPPPDPPTGVTATAANTGIPAGTTLTDVTWNNTTHGTSNGTVGSPQLWENINFLTSSNPVVSGDHKIFRNCKWNGRDVIARNCENVEFDHCEASKFTVSSAIDIRYLDIKSIPTPGLDAFGITSDSGYMCQDILVDGFFLQGDSASLIGGSGNHYDAIQVRGVDGAIFRNMYLDLGTTFNSYFNATIFLENANGGNTDITIEHVYSRSAAWFHFYFFCTNLVINDLVLAPLLTSPVQKYVYSPWVAPASQTNVRLWDGTPYVLAAGS